MLASIKKKNYFHPLLIWVILLFWYFIFADKFLSTFQDKLDYLIAEQSFWLFHQTPKEAEKITIVAIDEASRRKLNMKWPWERSLTARLISDIASLSPETISLDIVFSGRSEDEKDKALAAALKSHPKVVLGYVLTKSGQEKPLKDFVDAASSMGFVNKVMRGAVVVQARTFHVVNEKEVAFSLEIETLLNYLGLDKKHIRVNHEGIFLKDELIVPSPQGLIPLNYLVHPNNFRTIPAAAVLEKKVNPSDFKGRIVLVGVTDPLIHDEYLTPFGVWPGVAIQGNSLVMLLSKRFLYSAPTVQNVLFAFLLGLLIIFINAKFEFFRSSMLTLVLLLCLYFSLLYLRAGDIHFSYTAILFSGMTAYLVPNLFSYLSLLYLGSRLKNLAITDPFTGFYSPRYFVLQFNEKLKSRDGLVFIGLRIGNYRQLALRLDFEQIKTMSRLFGKYLRSHAENHFKACLFSRLSNDTLALVVEGAKKEEVEASFRAFFKRAKGLDWDLKGEKVSVSLKGCLIHISNANMGTSDDVISQMETLFDKGKEGQIVVEELREAVGENRKTKYENILDFIAYDWEERTRDLEEALKEILETNKRLDQLNWGALTALARAIDAKSKWTAGHSERVTKLALKIGDVLGLTREELEDLHRAGLLHDIGKIGTPGEVIDKPATLTEEENRIIREHPSLGARILEPIKAYVNIIPMVKQHHEWFNGEGYPDGIVREAITLGARILAVADVYDALSSERPYRPAMDPDQVLPIMREKSGTHFDPVVVEAFFKAMERDMNPKEDRVLD